MTRRTILFESVGRNKLSFECDVLWIDDEPDFFAMARAVKKHKALMSNDIDFGFDPDRPITEGGAIYAGGRSVGAWKVKP